METFVIIMIALGGTIVIGGNIFIIGRGIIQWCKNNNSPKLTVAATVVTKRGHASRHNHNNHSHTTTTYYVTFQLESNERMEFLVRGTEYGMLVEGDYGRLTFQGTRYLGFERI